MKSVYFTAILFSFAGAVLAQGTETKLESLRNKILLELQDVKGEYSVVYENLSTPSDTIMINEHKIFHAASTMKTAVMIEAFRQASEGIISLDDSVLVKNEFKSIVDSSLYSMELDRDSGESLYEKLNRYTSVRELIYTMITVSSNLATNIIIDLVGASNVQRTIDKMGVRNMKVLRGVEDIKAFDKGLNNITTAYDLAVLFSQIALGKAVSEKASLEMTDILLDQKFNEMIPARLPEGVKTAHKTGSITGIQHDSGFIILPDGRKYVLVILFANLENNASAIKAGANISRLIYDYIENKI